MYTVLYWCVSSRLLHRAWRGSVIHSRPVRSCLTCALDRRWHWMFCLRPSVSRCSQNRWRFSVTTAMSDTWPSPVRRSGSVWAKSLRIGSLQGRLNRWAHWARAQGPWIFFFLRAPNWLWWNKFSALTFAKINFKGNPVNTFYSEGPRSAGGAQGPSAGKDGTGSLYLSLRPQSQTLVADQSLRPS